MSDLVWTAIIAAVPPTVVGVLNFVKLKEVHAIVPEIKKELEVVKKVVVANGSKNH